MADGRVRILYCSSCGYLTRALSAASEIEAKHGQPVELVAVHGGRFEIEVDGEVVCKRKRLSLPAQEDVLLAVEQALTTSAPGT